MKATEQFFTVVLVMLCKAVLDFESVDRILKCDIQMIATEQYFTVVLFIMLCKVVLDFESVDKILKCDHSYESSTFLFCCSVYSGMLFQCLTP